MRTDRPDQSESRAAEVLTKRTLATLSHAVEAIADAAGPDATVISLFQRGAYFAPMVARYRRMVECGSTVLIAYVGDGPVVADAHHVTLAEDHPLATEWAIVLLAPGVAAHVRGQDLKDFDPTAADLESGRRFATTFGFDRRLAADHAQQLLRELSPSMEPRSIERITDAIRTTQEAPISVPERCLTIAASVLARQLEGSERELTEVSARLAAETDLATRDRLTGLFNREGLARWLGGASTNGLPMPAMGVILIDLDRFKQVNDTQGHVVGDRVLVGVAAAIVNATRSGDVAARWGGDEFIALCPHTSDEELRSIAERIIAGIAEVDIDGVRITASAGLQTCSKRPLPLEGADAAMYSAKSAGGGRFALAAT